MDIGVKHLGVCIGTKEIQHLSVVNLIQLDSTPSVFTSCCKKAKFIHPEKGMVCGVHVSKTAIRICKKDGSVSDKPTVSELQDFLRANGMNAVGKRDVLFQRACTKATVAIPKAKAVASFASNTVQLHDAVRAWIERDWNVLKNITDVYIEHQPVYKNPVMKTVQIIVFTTLRDRYLSDGVSPNFHFVHAGKKIKGETVGDEGYADRKKGGILRAKTYLELVHGEKWLTYLDSLSKKDDVCDALCMWLDVVGK